MSNATECISILTANDDDNCSFISATFEETENFNDWLDRNGGFIIQTENFSNSMIEGKADPLLNQINAQEIHLGSDNELLSEYCNDRIEDKIEKRKFLTPTILRSNKSPTDKNMNTLSKTSESMSKYEKIELLVKPGIFICVYHLSDKCKVTFEDQNNCEILPPFYVNTKELTAHPHSEAIKQTVENVKKEILGPNVETLMPCVNGEKGLHVYICPQMECQEAHFKYAAAKLHALIHLGIKPYACDHPRCEWRFFTLFKLKRHQETHTKKKHYECPLTDCKKRFTTRYNLNIHLKLHERPAELECPVKGCNERFQTPRIREVHLKQHDRSEAEFTCTISSCQKRFFTLMALNTHLRTHSHNEDELICKWPNCGRVFKQPCRLKEHYNHHIGRRPYKCNYCDWSFFTSSKLKRHTASHLNDRKFRCNFCNKSFLRSEHLKDHMDTHSINQNFIICKGMYD